MPVFTSNFITKPFDVKEVQARVKRQLSVYKEQCQLAEQNRFLMQQTSRKTLSPEDRTGFVRQLIDIGENDLNNLAAKLDTLEELLSSLGADDGYGAASLEQVVPVAAKIARDLDDLDHVSLGAGLAFHF